MRNIIIRINESRNKSGIGSNEKDKLFEKR